jgi:hypothetical protein
VRAAASRRCVCTVASSERLTHSIALSRRASVPAAAAICRVEWGSWMPHAREGGVVWSKRGWWVIRRAVDGVGAVQHTPRQERPESFRGSFAENLDQNFLQP